MDVTQLLARVQQGDSDARAALVQSTYDELKRIAGARMRRERADHTLTPTALVHEVSAQLLGRDAAGAENREQFLALAARAMRNLLVDHARSRGRQKRGGGAKPLALEEALVASEEQSSEIIDLHEALEALAEIDERKARTVEMRYFGGLSVEETASALGVSPATVKRDWDVAKSWLLRELRGGDLGAE